MDSQDAIAQDVITVIVVLLQKAVNVTILLANVHAGKERPEEGARDALLGTGITRRMAVNVIYKQQFPYNYK
jgi:hypothetical protein